ncbi:phage tail tape measure C-terminal domain-containing protein [Pseudescherichia vulneris]
MADDIVAIGAEIDASQTKQAVTDFKNVAKAADSAEASINNMGKSADSMGKSMSDVEATVKRQTDEMNRYARQMAENDKWERKANEWAANKLKNAKVTTAAVETETRALQVNNTTMRETAVIMRELSAGKMSRVGGSASILLQSLGLGFAGSTAGMLAITGIQMYMEHLKELKKEQDDYIKSHSSSKYASAMTFTQYQSLADKAGDLKDLMGAGFSGTVIEDFANQLKSLSQVMDMTDEQAKTLMTDLLKDPTDAAKALADQTGLLTDAEADQIAMLQRSLGVTAAQTKLMDDLKQSTIAQTGAIYDQVSAWEKLKNWFTPVQFASKSTLDAQITDLNQQMVGTSGSKLAELQARANRLYDARRKIAEDESTQRQWLLAGRETASRKEFTRLSHQNAPEWMRKNYEYQDRAATIQDAWQYSGADKSQLDTALHNLSLSIYAKKPKKGRTGISSGVRQGVRVDQLDDQMSNLLDSATRSQQDFVRQYLQRDDPLFRNQYQMQIEAVMRQRDARIRQARDEITRAERSLDDKVRLKQLTPDQAASSKVEYERSFTQIQKGWVESADTAVASIGRMDDTSKDFAAGFEKGTSRWFDEAQRTGDQAQRLSTQIFGGLTDTLTEFFTTGKNGWDDYITFVLKKLVAFEVQAEMLPLARNLVGMAWGSVKGMFGAAQPSGDASTIVDGTSGIAPYPSIGGVSATRKSPDINVNVRLSSVGGSGATHGGGGGLSDTDMTKLSTRLKKELTHEINKQILKANRQGGINRRAQGHN